MKLHQPLYSFTHLIIIIIMSYCVLLCDAKIVDKTISILGKEIEKKIKRV